MKKILLGLVIAVMMTGSGFAQSIEQLNNCVYLKYNADNLVTKAYNGYSVDPEVDKNELELIKKAHYFAVTWSALCD